MTYLVCYRLAQTRPRVPRKSPRERSSRQTPPSCFVSARVIGRLAEGTFGFGRLTFYQNFHPRLPRSLPPPPPPPPPATHPARRLTAASAAPPTWRAPGGAADAASANRIAVDWFPQRGGTSVVLKTSASASAIKNRPTPNTAPTVSPTRGTVARQRNERPEVPPRVPRKPRRTWRRASTDDRASGGEREKPK
jgi:hypothetical protein